MALGKLDLLYNNTPDKKKKEGGKNDKTHNFPTESV